MNSLGLRLFETALASVLLVFVSCSPGKTDTTANEPDVLGTMHFIEEVVIGTLEGEPEYLFRGIGAGAIMRNRNLVLADGGDGFLRLYGPDGIFIDNIGRAGDGPGEFGQIRSVAAVGSTFVVVDTGSLKLSRFDQDGTYLDATSIPSGYFRHHLAASNQLIAIAAANTPINNTGASKFPTDHFIHTFDESLGALTSLGTLGDIFDPSDQLGRMQAYVTAVELAVTNNRIVAIPQLFQCRLAEYIRAESGYETIVLSSPNCPDRGYRRTSDEEHDALEALREDDFDSVPGRITGMWIQDEHFTALTWRNSFAPFFLADETLIHVFTEYRDDDWYYWAEEYAPDGTYVGKYLVSGLPNKGRQNFLAYDGEDDIIIGSVLPNGAPWQRSTD